MGKFKRGKFIESVKTEVLSDDKTLVILEDEEIQSLDPNNVDRNVILPLETTASGFSFKIFNAGSIGNLLVKDSTNIVIITTLSPNTMGSFSCDGIRWKGTSGSSTSSSGGGDADTGDLESMIFFRSIF